MPLTLKSRIGVDTLRKLEAAATRRYAEATRLEAEERLGALYLFGYTIEMRLKAAHYHLAGISPAADLNLPLPPTNLSIRRIAENAIRRIHSTGVTVGHDLIGWAMLVIDSRRASVLGPFTATFRDVLLDHAQKASLCWTEILRYRANKPYNQELEAVAAAAAWFRRNYRRLWS